uniref:Uncharacterized protein n=1 Tax=Romanomermis culicivorax TaxID=13658 RepID=A0A915JFD9_ROMCU
MMYVFTIQSTNDDESFSTLKITVDKIFVVQSAWDRTTAHRVDVRIHNIENALELWFGLTFFDHWQIVAQSSQARFELLFFHVSSKASIVNQVLCFTAGTLLSFEYTVL